MNVPKGAILEDPRGRTCWNKTLGRQIKPVTLIRTQDLRQTHNQSVTVDLVFSSTRYFQSLQTKPKLRELFNDKCNSVASRIYATRLAKPKLWWGVLRVPPWNKRTYFVSKLDTLWRFSLMVVRIKYKPLTQAGVTQLAERQISNLKVASSNLVSCSIFHLPL